MPSYNDMVENYSTFQYKLPDCYIYLYHTDEYFILPQYPGSINDNMDSHFSEQNALARTAPVYSYNNSGPRTVQINLKLHRDMMNDLNTSNAHVSMNVDGKLGVDIINNPDYDYIDLLIKKLQSIALPRYKATTKAVTPPMVAVQLGQDIFIKGVVASGISTTYDLPIMSNNKYSQVGIGFTISEITPYDADSVGRLGSFRGVTSGLKAKMIANNK